jgi:hypothetical protein
MEHKIMQVMYEREPSTRLSGQVEVDDAYLAGENPRFKAGSGSENKTRSSSTSRPTTGINPCTQFLRKRPSVVAMRCPVMA